MDTYAIVTTLVATVFMLAFIAWYDGGDDG